ncbi:MAG TPA: hypothetical protein VKA53_07990 [Thermoanaerobaculia bacterium]|nr:hypothetical protein [Thermoanaerobaculia bacterium]
MKRLLYTIGILLATLSGIGGANRLEAAPMVPAVPAIDLGQVRAAQREADRLCAKDGGRMWGVSLCGPLLFVDAGSKTAASTRPWPVPGARHQDGAWTGPLPPSLGIANTSFTWHGESWSMILWPLPKDRFARQALLMHELWHRVQKKIGFPPEGPANAQLDTVKGRALLRLEWRALAVAIESIESEAAKRKSAVKAALVFRQRRRELFKQAATEERELEMHEGLAEYTGFALAARSLAERRRHTLERLQSFDERDSFVRSFAYASGPAYGLLLDEVAPGWERKAKASDDLGGLLQGKMEISLPRDLAAATEKAEGEFDGSKVIAEEEKRATEKRRLVARLRQSYVTGPRLVLPLHAMHMDFDPNHLQPLGKAGTVYRPLTVRDDWGKLVASGGALIASDWKSVVVPRPDASQENLAGDGWTLELAPGWRVVAGARAGELTLSSKN